jgi:asparagine synthase (glutamine-hydrolysing)
MSRGTRAGAVHKAGTLLHIASGSLEGYFGRLIGHDAKLQESLFTSDARARLVGHNPMGHAYQILARTRHESSWADRLMEFFLLSILPDDFLAKVDLGTMGVSMEARCPFLDLDVINLATRIPAAVRFRGFRRKGLLRRLARRHLPREIVDRKKRGFTVPVGLWFRQQWTDLVQEFVLGPHVERRGWFRRDALKQIVDEHCNGVDHSGLLWAFLVLEIWLRLVVDGTLSPADTL